MKLTLRLQHGTRNSEHRLEIDSPGPDGHGVVKCHLDGEEILPDCIRVAPGTYSILLNGRSYEARIFPSGSAGPEAASRRVVTVGSRHFLVEVHDPRRRPSAHTLAGHAGPQEIVAPMPGRILKILMKEGQEVVQGTGLLVIEAMKMQNELRAPRSGRIARLYVKEGTGVETGAKLIRLD